jgi:hypothetical protein
METALVELTLEEKIQAHFLDFEKQAGEWMTKAKTIKVTDAKQTDLMKDAKDARLALKGIRVSVEKKHTELKADALKYGQTLDKVKRTLVGYIEPIEEYLLEQEKFAEVQEEKRRKELFDKRIIELKPYISEHEAKAFPLGDMKDEAFANLLNGNKLAKEAKENEAKAQQTLREEQQQRDEAERKRLAAENEKLRKEKEQQEAKLKKEREERLKLEREAEAKRIEEENKKKQEQAAKRKAARQPDKEKLQTLAVTLHEFNFPKMSSEDGEAVMADVKVLINKIIMHINKKIELL